MGEDKRNECKRGGEKEQTGVSRNKAMKRGSISLTSGSRFRPQNLLVVELHADAQLASPRIDGLQTHHVTRASPLGSRFPGDFFWHLQKSLDRRSDRYWRIRGKKGSCFREV